METISLVIDSEPLIDAFAYRGFIYGWNFENQFLAYSVDTLIEQLGTTYGDAGLAASYALFCSRGIGATAAMKGAFRARDIGKGETFRLQLEPYARVENRQGFDHIIDLQITGYGTLNWPHL